MTIRQLSVAEPFASFLRLNMKHYETRPRRTNVRGTVAIQASKTVWDYPEGVPAIPRTYSGQIIALADLTDCIEMTPEFIASLSDLERATGFYSVGRFAWKLENIRPVDPVESRGYPFLKYIEYEEA